MVRQQRDGVGRGTAGTEISGAVFDHVAFVTGLRCSRDVFA